MLFCLLCCCYCCFSCLAVVVLWLCFLSCCCSYCCCCGSLAVRSLLLPPAAACCCFTTIPNSVRTQARSTSESAGVGCGRVPPRLKDISLTALGGQPGQPGPDLPGQWRGAPPVPTELWDHTALWVLRKSIELCLPALCCSRPTYRSYQPYYTSLLLGGCVLVGYAKLFGE